MNEMTEMNETDMNSDLPDSPASSSDAPDASEITAAAATDPNIARAAERERRIQAARNAVVETWEDLYLAPELEDLIKKAGFTKPTNVQAKTIPLALEGLDLLVSSQTGSGKTAAFVLPMVELLRGREGLKGLILAPSREIALQSHAVMKEFGEPLGIKSICLIGGIDLRSDERALATYPQVIIATPGRLCDHIERGNLWLEYLEFLVLDEADRMLDLGFSAQLSRIMLELPPSRQTLLFSATIPPSVDKLADRMLYRPEKVQIGRPANQPAKVEQKFVHVDPKEKFRALLRVLKQEKGTVFVFIGSKLNVTKTFRSLRSAGFYEATQLHSDLRQKDREQALQDFKDGAFRVILATDVIGRGIHVDGVNLVVNYDLPREASDYVHRIGRTGRAGESGKAISFITPKDGRSFQEILKLTGQKAPESMEDLSSGSDRGSDRGGDRSGRGSTSSRDSGPRAHSSSSRDSGPRSISNAGSGRSEIRSSERTSERPSRSSESPRRSESSAPRRGDSRSAPRSDRAPARGPSRGPVRADSYTYGNGERERPDPRDADGPRAAPGRYSGMRAPVRAADSFRDQTDRDDRDDRDSNQHRDHHDESRDDRDTNESSAPRAATDDRDGPREPLLNEDGTPRKRRRRGGRGRRSSGGSNGGSSGDSGSVSSGHQSDSADRPSRSRPKE